MKVTVKWKGKAKLVRARKNIARLDNAGVDYGYFARQGTHPEAGVNYPTLMSYHELRIKGDYKARPVFRRSLEAYGDMLEKNISNGVTRYLRDSPVRKQNTHKMFSMWGRDGVNITRTGFGDSSMLASNTPHTIRRKGGRNTPLVDWGILRDKLSYKTTLKNRVFTPYG